MRRFWDIVIEPILDAVQPEILVEIGSDRGDNTINLLEFCQRNDARLHVIDPLPKYDVEAWKEKYHRHLVFHKDLSLNALPLIEKFDVVLIDGDHNWHTVFNELKLIERSSQEDSQSFPLVMLHDIGWPYGRRDLYYDPENIPGESQQPYKKKGISPDLPELVDKGGLNQHLYNAARANEPKSGVLTAVEDFMDETQQQLDLIKLPGLNGLGILVPEQLKRENTKLADLLEKLNPSTIIVNYVECLEEARLKEQIERSEQHNKLQKLKKDFNDSQAEIQAQSIDLRDAQKETAQLRQQLRRQRRQLRQQQLRMQRRQQRRQRRQLRRQQLRMQRRQQRRQHRQINKVQKEAQQARATANKLKSWLDELDASIVALFDSRQWKIGYIVGEVYRRVRRKSRTQTAQDTVFSLLAGYRDWRGSQGHLRIEPRNEGQPSRYEPAKSENLPQKLSSTGTAEESDVEGLPQESPGAETAEENDFSVKSEEPSSITVSEQQYQGFSEYVLRELSSLPPPTILIPIYNAYEDVKRCLEAVVRNTTAPAELLLVNDASSDSKISSLLEKYTILENVRVLENEVNLGFVRTVNCGFTESKGDVVLLNSDTEVTPRWLENLMLAAYRDSRTATATAISNNAGAFSVPKVGGGKRHSQRA